MTDEPRFLVSPTSSLRGDLTVCGAKNSVLKLMVATLLAEGVHVLENVPDITDVRAMAELLRSVGQSVEIDSSRSQVVFETPPPTELKPIASYEHVVRLRASIVALGALLVRCGRVEIALPGGDDFGQRPVDYHIDALRTMGATITTNHGVISAVAPLLTGSRVVLEFPSHTATDNLLMAAVLAKGHTTIENAAREPEVLDLADMLTEMGARIEGAGTSKIEIDGVETLSPCRHRVIPDRVEAASYMAAVAVAGGSVYLRDARVRHMETLLRKLTRLGVSVDPDEEGIRVTSSGSLVGVDVATLPYPGVATDYQPLIVTMLAVASGVSVVTENLYAGRFRYIDELLRLGADITTDGHHVVIRGVSRLSGAQVRAVDIRAGVALVVAGLVADGETEIFGIEHIERGYQSIHTRLTSLGAQIQRIG
jgi:UDP-N-acetylglucosamine 1-carboxyvinyltransferase